MMAIVVFMPSMAKADIIEWTASTTYSGGTEGFDYEFAIWVATSTPGDGLVPLQIFAIEGELGTLALGGMGDFNPEATQVFNHTFDQFYDSGFNPGTLSTVITPDGMDGGVYHDALISFINGGELVLHEFTMELDYDDGVTAWEQSLPFNSTFANLHISAAMVGGDLGYLQVENFDWSGGEMYIQGRIAQAVPEPSSAALLLPLAIGGLLYRRRRK